MCTLHSWVDPEFTDEENTTSSNTGSFEDGEEVENRGIIDNKIFIRIAKMGGLEPVRRKENVKINII